MAPGYSSGAAANEDAWLGHLVFADVGISTRVRVTHTHIQEACGHMQRHSLRSRSHRTTVIYGRYDALPFHPPEPQRRFTEFRGAIITLPATKSDTLRESSLRYIFYPIASNEEPTDRHVFLLWRCRTLENPRRGAHVRDMESAGVQIRIVEAVL